MKKGKKAAKTIGFIFGALILMVTSVVLYIKAALPSIPVEALQVKPTPERIARGRYLFNYVAGCEDCHSSRDEHLFAMPMKAGTDGGGGEVFDKREGFPGTYVAKNITPYKLAGWTDGELLRAITAGVGKDGHALFPIMPYPDFGRADKEDIYSIIAYMRTLKPVKTEQPASHSDFPMNIIINTLPAKPRFQTMPDRTNSVRYGGYLVNMGSCVTCHSQADKGKVIPGMEFAGGRQLPLATGGTVSSANITPDRETGIGNWTKETFIQRFRAYGDSSFRPAAITDGAFNTIMPWTQFGKMTVEDLGAIYDFLRTVKPIKNKVIKFQ